jgi:hypothetical protein
MVGVDYARLLISDPDVLGEWRHNESLDGRADYVFWGKDAAHLAAIFAATEMNGQYGWLDLPEGEAQRKARVLRDYQKTYELKVGDDYRPHSDHWRVMTPTRISTTESASVDLAGVEICNFMTTWGDGVFDVHRDLGRSGELVRLRIEFEDIP